MNKNKSILLASGYYVSTMVNPLYGKVGNEPKSHKVWRKAGVFMGYVGEESDIISNNL